MRKLLIALALLGFASPAAAQTLWEQVTPAMSVEEVRRLYPASSTIRHRPDRTTIGGHVVSPDCRADVHIVHRSGKVEGVVLRGEPAIFARCGSAVLEGLTARYGPADSHETARPSILKRVRTTYQWARSGLFLRFVRFSTEGWGGAGLSNASWEMSFASEPGPVEL